MRATLNRIPKALTAVSGSLAALALLLSAQGCSTTASATTTTVAGPTPASALKVFNYYVTAERVATANQNELLAQSVTGSAQYTQVTAEYLIAQAAGRAVTTPTYGKPTLYVPKLTTYPQWFMAAVPQYPAGGGAAQTAVMVFDKPDAATDWTLYDSVLLSRDAPALNVAVKDGYATALRTTDSTLAFGPDEVGAVQASVVDEGPANPARSVLAPGPQTTGLYQSFAAAARQARAEGNNYSWEMEGTSYPFFALRTTDGGAIVVYTMGLYTTTTPVKWSPERTIPVPGVFKPLLPADQVRITRLLDADSSGQYLAIDPPAAKNGSRTGKLQVVGALTCPSYVKGA